VQASISSVQVLNHNAATTLSWNNIINSTHGSLSGTTFTANTSGIFEVSAQIGVAGHALGAQYTIQLSATVGGDTRSSEQAGVLPSAFLGYPTVMLSPQQFRMTAGQTMTLSLYHFNNGSAGLTVSNGKSYLNIKKVGN